MSINTTPHFFANPRALPGKPDLGTAELLGIDAPQRVREYLALCPRYAPTPLHRLDALAKKTGVGAIFAKDEGQRLGLRSFKALGGAYAVARLVRGWASKALGRPVMPDELQSDAVRRIAASHTVTSATDGNHGRSVAAGAKLFGSKAVIFVHPHVNQERRDAMAAFGARIVEVAGSYDDSVAECARAAAENGWQVVSDTSWPGYTEIPGLVMQGYTLMVAEALEVMPEPPTHIFIQGGVGGVAAAVAAHLADLFGKMRPRLIVVEPERANCLLESARAGKPVTTVQQESTVMAMLDCLSPSGLAWPILDAHADAFIDLPEEAAPAAMRRLAFPEAGDRAIVAGESGAVGLAGFMAAMSEAPVREALGLGLASRILVFITEGATAPSTYHRLVGLSPEAIAKGINR